jgi:uncharacterized repeat protein (TIGR03833 family)
MHRRRDTQQQHQHRRNDPNTNNASLIGTEVSVVQKQDQGTGRLTEGTVSEILTNSLSHPRGIKVRLTDGTVGRISGPRTEGNNYSDNMEDDDAPPARQGPSLADFMVPLTSTSLPRTTAPQSPPTSPPESEWACQACTFVNSGLLPQCEICQTSRDSK